MYHKVSKCGRAAFAGALVVVSVGVCVLAGWFFEWERLMRLSPGLVAMNSATAVSFILAGISLMLRVRSRADVKSSVQNLAASGCAGAVALIGLARLVAALGGWDVGVDRVLFAAHVRDLQDGMAPNTASSFLLLGGALWWGDAKTHVVRVGAEVTAILVGLEAVIAIVGYIYGVGSLSSMDGFNRMALHTALTFVLLAASLLFSHADHGLLAALTGGGAGGAMARRLLPAAILAPILLGWLTLYGTTSGTYPVAVGEALFAIGNVVVFTALVSWCAHGLYRLDLRRVKAEEALRESEERFYGAFEHAPGGVALLSPDGHWLKVNRALCDIIGYSEAALLTRNFQDITHPEDLASCLENVRQLTDGEISSYRGEKRYVHLDGHFVAVSFHLSLVRDRQGQPHYLIGQIQDITERRKAESAIRFNEQRYRTLVEATTAVVWDTPASGQFEVAQPSWTAFTGQSFEELRGSGWLNAVHPDDKAETGRVWSAAVASKSIYEWEHRLRARDQTYHDMLVRAVPILADDGSIRQFIGIHTDITARKEAEKSLRLLGSAVEQAGESIVITDAQLDLPGPAIVFVNPAYTAMTGYSAGEALGRTPRVLHGPRTDREVLRRLRSDLERGGNFEGETINYRKDGSEFTIKWHIAPIRDGAGAVTHFVAIQRDISGQRRLEAQLFESQKLETVGKLAGGIAHEFNSILTAIIGQSELLLNDLPAGSPSQKNASEISTAAGRAATLTRQLLAYGRKQMLQPETLDLNRVIADLEGVIAHLMGSEVNIRVVPAPNLRAVKADAGQIEQVIMNIVMNARDAMPNGGKLTLETANVSFDGESPTHDPELKPGNYARLAITDTGGGMTAEAKAHLFEPFFSTKGVGQGTGLGLSTCYGIIKQSGGHLTVYSEPARGAVFKIYLPCVAAPAKGLPPRLDSPDLPRGTETILLVEDDPALREMAATLLERLGYHVLAAADGVAALDLKQQRAGEHIDLLFTDVVMPQMSGNELADRVRAASPRTRILFTSAYTENAIVHQGVMDKGVSILQKPFTPSALAKKLREVLDRSTAQMS